MNLETFNAGLLNVNTNLPVLSSLSSELSTRFYATGVTDEFSAAKAYEVGDYVIYDGNIYKCITDHTGEWNTTDFTKTQLLNDDAQLVFDDETYELQLKDSMDDIVWDSTTDKMFNISYESSNEGKYGCNQYLSVALADCTQDPTVTTQYTGPELKIPEILQAKAAKFIFDVSCAADIPVSPDNTVKLAIDVTNYTYFTESGKTLTDILTIKPNDIFRLTFDTCALLVDDTLSYVVTRTNLNKSIA